MKEHDVTNLDNGSLYVDANYNTGYKCSKCGGSVDIVTLTSYPGATQYTCLKCGARKTIEHKIPEPVEINMD